MKKNFTFVAIMLLFAAASAQTVSVTLTGRDAQNHHLPLNRVVVSNHSKGWQETLVWPDTVLVMTATGIGNVETFQETSLLLSQNNPNPFDGSTFVNLQVTNPDVVSIEITDIAGRIVETFQETSLQPGTHEIRITLSSPGLYFLTARQNGRTASVKMVNRGHGGGNAITFTNIVETFPETSLELFPETSLESFPKTSLESFPKSFPETSPETFPETSCKSPLPQPKIAHRGETDNPFDLGDQMEYVGFATFNGTEIVSSHVLQVLDVSQIVVLTFEDGLPCFGTPTVTDHEGNVYATVQIGQQCWMRDNLRTTTSPSTGTYLVPTVNTGYTYTGKQARWYNNDSATYVPMNYGLLYNWNAAMDTFNTAYGETSVNTDVSNEVLVGFTSNRRGVCPAGWHLPSDAEWFQLTDYVSNQGDYACDDNSDNIAKALASTEGWSNGEFCDDPCDVGYNLSTNNTLGFGAVPAGYYWSLGFSGTSHGAFLWSSTESEPLSSEVFTRRMLYYYPGVYWGIGDKSDGNSVRCVRD